MNTDLNYRAIWLSGVHSEYLIVVGSDKAKCLLNIRISISLNDNLRSRHLNHKH